MEMLTDQMKIKNSWENTGKQNKILIIIEIFFAKRNPQKYYKRNTVWCSDGLYQETTHKTNVSPIDLNYLLSEFFVYIIIERVIK